MTSSRGGGGASGGAAGGASVFEGRAGKGGDRGCESSAAAAGKPPYGNVTVTVQPTPAVTAPEPRMLSVQVWDKSNVTPVEKAIRSAGLGLNPINDGNNIRLPIPDLTEERRKELAKLASKYAENARIAIRNVRRDGMENLKDDEKKKDISEDDRKRSEEDVQKLTDAHVADTDAVVAAKVKEILTQ